MREWKVEDRSEWLTFAHRVVKKTSSSGHEQYTLWDSRCHLGLV